MLRWSLKMAGDSFCPSWQVSWGDMSFNPMLLGKKQLQLHPKLSVFLIFVVLGRSSKVQDANGPTHPLVVKHGNGKSTIYRLFFSLKSTFRVFPLPFLTRLQ